ncbi:MAG: elongation factor 1-beta [Methanomassiliicoccales archaeon]
MAKVAMTFRLMPASPDYDFKDVKERIMAVLPSGSELRDIRIVPVAFGLSAAEVMIVCEDKGGIAEEIETALSSLEGIESASVQDLTLL